MYNMLFLMLVQMLDQMYNILDVWYLEFPLYLQMYNITNVHVRQLDIWTDIGTSDIPDV